MSAEDYVGHLESQIEAFEKSLADEQIKNDELVAENNELQVIKRKYNEDPKFKWANKVLLKVPMFCVLVMIFVPIALMVVL